MADNKDLYQPNYVTDYSLITQERTAKLELLSHLVNNSSRAIVLCGVKGIGKTTLLRLFQQQMDNALIGCWLQGSESLTLEQIIDKLSEKCPEKQTLLDYFEQLKAAQQKIVLVIDDAGKLAPYLMSSLIDYATPHPVLKLVFVLTHDELAIKACSDRAIEESHIIEIPPLSEAQCGEFLQYLAVKSTLPISLDKITDDMIVKVYQETHGIPAKILAHLPLLVRSQKHKPIAKRPPWLMILLGLVLIIWLLLNNTVASSLVKSFIDRLPFP